MFTPPTSTVLPTCLLILLTWPALASPAETTAAGTPSMLEGLEWRSIGPYRGGRVTTVTGVPGNPMLYYMGATGGGVWKTENAGLTWTNLSDGFFEVGTIGAVAVAESDSNVIYVGTGESPIRGVTTSSGDGVWKSTDAGKTWKHVGLEEGGQIARIEIHPGRSDVAYVAVQGQIWGPNDERGVYRTTDGGASWEQVLQVGPQTGASDLSMDPTNPRILYAAMWNHGRKPWFIHSGGTDGGIFKTTDGGETWRKLEGGLPEMVGKIGVDVSASNPDRVYAIVEAEPGQGGLWRSDNAGGSWSLIHGHRVLHTRAWYYNHITADPVDDDTVYVLNVPLMKSIDAGESWTRISVPHGDHHDLWINPDDNRNMVNGNDGGATVSFDGGTTWSSLENQPTGQFYRLSTDNQVPFRIYGGQQDRRTVAIASETWDGGIGTEDYYDVGGGESAHIAFDPDDPTLIYATTINGTLTEYDHSTGLARYIIPFPELVYGMDSRDLKYRANWNAPVAVSPHRPSTIYYGTQMLLRSQDRGQTWVEISPDLTRDDEEKQGRNGGPLTPENVGAEFYNTIYSVVESEHEEGLIWVGSDDGLVHLTRDGGANWADVSPDHPGEALINSIEISPHDPAKAFLAVTGYRLDDPAPYIYVTTDYGEHWTRIDGGLPARAFVRVVREDPAQSGLLYAGTELGLFVSFDDGASWGSLDLNLPPVPITDLGVRQHKLVAATQGRGFWVLDDLFLVRQTGASSTNASLTVFAPDSAVLRKFHGGGVGIQGANPVYGVPIYYYLADEPEGSLTIDIFDRDGRAIRSYASEEGDFERCVLGNNDPRRPVEFDYPSTNEGLNRWVWDLKHQGLHCVDDITLFEGFEGPSVAPGTYTARVSIGEAAQEVSFVVELDPRVRATDEEIRFWSARVAEVRGLVDEALVSLEALRKTRRQIEALLEDHADDAELAPVATKAIELMTAWDGQLIQVLHETYEDEDAWESMLVGQIRFLMDVIDETGAPVTEGALERLEHLDAEWAERKTELREIETGFVDAVNRWARNRGIPYVAAPTID